MREVLAYPGPALLDVVTARTELSMRLKIKLEKMKGFTLYIDKASSPVAAMRWLRKAA